MKITLSTDTPQRPIAFVDWTVLLRRAIATYESRSEGDNAQIVIENTELGIKAVIEANEAYQKETTALRKQQNKRKRPQNARDKPLSASIEDRLSESQIEALEALRLRLLRRGRKQK